MLNLLPSLDRHISSRVYLSHTSPLTPTPMNATVTHLERAKNADGTWVYDEAKLAKFRAQQVRKMERQNAKVQADPVRYKSYDVCDPQAFAESMVKAYKHNFCVWVQQS